jgi:hypothetical protein
LVGETTVKSFCRIIGDMVNRPYELGRVDCFRSILEYLEIIGVDVPESFEGQTLASYPDYFKTQPAEAKETAVRLFDSLLPEVNANLTIAGDVLLLQYKGSPPFLAINGGNGSVVTASVECGFKVYSGSRLDRLKGWTCQAHLR